MRGVPRGDTGAAGGPRVRLLAVRAVFFDLDGTLVDSRTIVPDSYVAVVEGLGGRASREQVVAAYGAGASDAVLAQLLGHEPPAEAREHYLRELESRAGSATLYHGVRRAVERLAGRLPLGVYSGASAEAVSILLEPTGLRPFFRAVLGGDEITRPKPDPEGLRVLAGRLGLDTREVAYVGDAARDAEAARACGAVAVVAGWGHEFTAEAAADLVIPSPDDLLDAFDGLT
jgi:HAD superfamily hydrolase (TIGR01509 family)